MGALYFVPPRDFSIAVSGKNIELEPGSKAGEKSASHGKTKHPLGQPVSAELPPTKPLPKLPDPIFTTVTAPVSPKPTGSKPFKDMNELLKNLQVEHAPRDQTLVLHVSGAVDVTRLIEAANIMGRSANVTVHLVTSE